MKKKLLTILLSVLVVGSVINVGTSVEAKATENSNYASDEKEDFSVKFIKADYYDLENKDHLEFAGNASVGSTINFISESTGGVGNITYEYYITANKPNSSYHAELSSSPNFTWIPDSKGQYLVGVIAHDELGNTSSVGYLYSITN